MADYHAVPFRPGHSIRWSLTSIDVVERVASGSASRRRMISEARTHGVEPAGCMGFVTSGQTYGPPQTAVWHCDRGPVIYGLRDLPGNATDSNVCRGLFSNSDSH